MTFFSDEQAAELRECFFESAEEILQAMNDAGLRLEGRPNDTECIRNVRRSVHTLKGDSAACGFRELSELAHELEDVLANESITAKGTALAEVVLTAADTFHTMLSAYRLNQQPREGSALRQHIRNLLAGPADGAAVPEQLRFEWTEYEQMTISNAIGRGENVYLVALHLDPANPMPALGIQLARKALESLGAILAIHPGADDSVTGIRFVRAAISTKRKVKAIEKKCRIPTIVSDVAIERATANQQKNRDALEVLIESEAVAVSAPSSGPRQFVGSESRAGAGSISQPEGSAASANAISEKTLRVDAARIDIVMNLVGELIIGKSMLNRTISEFEKRYASDPLRGRFADALAFQSRVLGDLQKSVMNIRMVPIEQLFRRFPRIIRDITKELNREIALEIAGQNTDLDKSILDALAEPLAHLVRNAADHGIEPAAERVDAGKPACGKIRLNAYHEGNQVVIEVSDDGHGLDRDKIVERAIERGIVTTNEAERLTHAEALDLIFTPGLSTADEVTRISGRGVGMDVVRGVLERLKGSISIESEPGKGTTFRLMVPLTLASIQALLFHVKTKLYGIPLSSVVEITRVSESEIHRVDDREILRLRDQILTLVRLDRLFEGPRVQNSKRQYAIVVSTGSRRFGLIVDDLLGEEELVIKALEDRLAASELVDGASIMGDGTVVLILNVPAVVAQLGKIHAMEVPA